MRFLLILVLLVVLCATAWHAMMIGTGQNRILGAPQIENLVDQGVKAALEDPALDTVKVETDGRNVTLRGQVSSEAMRDDILSRASGARLLRSLTDEIDILATAEPFTFSITKAQSGALALSGHVPRRPVEEALLTEARSAAGGAAVSADLTLASGAPEGDWQGMSLKGLQAVSALTAGSLEISDQKVVLAGTVPDRSALNQIEALVAAAPMGDWTLDLEGSAPEGGFLFNAMKSPDGAILLDGHAPDEDTKGQILALAEELTGKAPAGDLVVATGMPDGGWPDRVKQGLRALQITENGVLTVAGRDVSLSGDVQTDADQTALDPLIGDGWSTQINVLNPTPSGDVTVTLGPDGATVANGVLPKGMERAALLAALPGVNITDLQESTETLVQDWAEPLEGLAIVLPRFETATARINGNRLSVTAVLKRGFSAAGSEASLRTVLDRSWNLDVSLQEMAPLAGVVVSKRDEQISISGVLPQGLAPEEILGAFGDTASGSALSAGGEGDADAWLRNVTALSDGFTLFGEANAEVASGSIDLNGKLLPGYDSDEAKAWIDAKLGEDWSVDLTADETPASEGDRRANLRSGEKESYRRGYWLPDVDFPVSVSRCKQEVDSAMANQKINFLTGSADIDQEGRVLLNRLASVSVRCLNSSVIRLEIGGHTDSAGNDGFNQRLSERRAQAVVQAMLDRGVRADAMDAKGYGEAEPIATNDTIAGRAENRRITFKWFENDG